MVFGFLGTFGRAPALRRLDDALRTVDLHPRLVPEAVKLTAVRLLAADAGGATPAADAFAAAAELLAYCMVGPDGFATANGDARLAQIEARIEAALRRGDGLDARLVLLCMHAGTIQPAVVRHFALEAATG